MCTACVQYMLFYCDLGWPVFWRIADMNISSIMWSDDKLFFNSWACYWQCSVTGDCGECLSAYCYSVWYCGPLAVLLVLSVYRRQVIGITLSVHGHEWRVGGRQSLWHVLHTNSSSSTSVSTQDYHHHWTHVCSYFFIIFRVSRMYEQFLSAVLRVLFSKSD